MSPVGGPFEDMRRRRRVDRMLREMERIGRPRRQISSATLWQTVVPGVLVVVLLCVFGFRLWHDPNADIIGYTSPGEVGEGELQYAVGGGTYRFMATQDGSDEPVAYDPCTPIQVMVNARTAPADADAILATALANVTEATGLEFELVGDSDEVPFAGADVETGEGWRPLLIGWTDATEMSEFDGELVGLGGSAIVEIDGRHWYVTGDVALDGPRLAELGTEVTVAVLQHELAHVIGLHHVDDEHELMHPVQTTARWGRGDLAGLERLGAVECA